MPPRQSMTAVEGAALPANRDAIGSWETFALITV
jgi:hypothetical protein